VTRPDFGAPAGIKLPEKSYSEVTYKTFLREFVFHENLTMATEGVAYSENLNSARATEGNHSRASVPAAKGPLLLDVLHRLVRRPQELLLLWNWKSALLSIILRAPIFLIASLRRGWEAAFSAVLTESLFCAVTAGFYGTFVQWVRNARPQWVTGLLITVLMPLAFQALEYGMHWLRGTPHLRAAEIASVVTSAVSALFNWYAMRRGALLVGGEGGDFSKDLARVPRLVVGFIVLLPRWLLERLKNDSGPDSQSALSNPPGGKPCR
jgi:hypothetical protein